MLILFWNKTYTGNNSGNIYYGFTDVAVFFIWRVCERWKATGKNSVEYDTSKIYGSRCADICHRKLLCISSKPDKRRGEHEK